MGLASRCRRVRVRVQSHKPAASRSYGRVPPLPLRTMRNGLFDGEDSCVYRPPATSRPSAADMPHRAPVVIEQVTPTSILSVDPSAIERCARTRHGWCVRSSRVISPEPQPVSAGSVCEETTPQPAPNHPACQHQTFKTTETQRHQTRRKLDRPLNRSQTCTTRFTTPRGPIGGSRLWTRVSADGTYP